MRCTRTALGPWRILVVVAASGCLSIPDAYPLREESLGLTAAQRAELGAALAKSFGVPRRPKVPQGLGLDEARVVAGQLIFKDLCANCHGVLGDGDGLVVDDRGGPRDFRRAVFKFTSTGAPTPTRADIERSVRVGLPGTRMESGFDDEPPERIEAAIEYLIFIAQRGAVERRLIAELADDELLEDALIDETLAEVAEDWRGASERVLTPAAPAPEASAASIARGRELFLSEEVKCADCHGAEADGEGPQAETLKDDWGQPIAPADLTEGEFRGGDRPIDLYRRIAGGIPGTPMPGMRSALSEAEIWSIVHYVKSLSADA